MGTCFRGSHDGVIVARRFLCRVGGFAILLLRVGFAVAYGVLSILYAVGLCLIGAFHISLSFFPLISVAANQRGGRRFNASLISPCSLPGRNGGLLGCMKSFIYSISVLAAAFSILGPVPATALTNGGDELATPYVAAFSRIFGISGAPRTGTMTLAVHDGLISGSYTGTSIAPDPLDNRTVPIAGTVSGNDGYVQLLIGAAITLRGTMNADGTISGTATENGRLYKFVAAPRPAAAGSRRT